MNLQSTWKKSCVSEAKIAAFSLIKKTPPDPQGIDAKQCYVNIAKAEKFMNCILTLTLSLLCVSSLMATR